MPTSSPDDESPRSRRKSLRALVAITILVIAALFLIYSYGLNVQSTRHFLEVRRLESPPNFYVELEGKELQAHPILLRSLQRLEGSEDEAIQFEGREEEINAVSRLLVEKYQQKYGSIPDEWRNRILYNKRFYEIFTVAEILLRTTTHMENFLSQAHHVSSSTPSTVGIPF